MKKIIDLPMFNPDLLKYSNGEKDLNVLHTAQMDIIRFMRKGIWSIEDNIKFAELEKRYPKMFNEISRRLNSYIEVEELRY